MKKIFSLFLISTLMLITPSIFPALAQTGSTAAVTTSTPYSAPSYAGQPITNNTPVVKKNTRSTGKGLLQQFKNLNNVASRAAVNNQVRLQKIQQRANSLITKRITALEQLISKIKNDNNLNSSQQASLIAEIQTSISSLTTLKSQIDADTTPQIALAETKTIITDYRIFAMVEPKIRYLIILNNLSSLTGNLQIAITQIQSLITSFQSQGLNTTTAQAVLNDISTQLQTINTTISNDMNEVEHTSIVSGYASTFGQIRSDLGNTIQTDFGKIRTDIGQLRTAFEQLISGPQNNTATPSGTTQPVVSSPPSTSSAQ